MITPSMRLDGKVAIVTGGGGSLGTVCSIALAEAGAAVVVAGRTLAKCEETAGKVRDIGGRALALKVDITDPDDCRNMVERTRAEFRTIDILFNNAGIAYPLLVVDSDPKEWMNVIHVNVNGTFLCTQPVARAMIEQKSGRIINMGTIAGGVGFPYRSAYGASKAAVTNLTKTLALELGPHGITVNEIAPTVIQSEINREFFQKQPEFYDRVLKRTALGRFGKPEDLAGLLVFLASPAASFITGQTVYVDGGYTSG